HKGAHKIYIDTAGRSPKDAGAIAELARALAPVRDLEVHLTIAATTAPAAIDGVFRRYQPIGIDHLLVTKLDEADDLGELVRAPAPRRGPSGPRPPAGRVPEDRGAPGEGRRRAPPQRGRGGARCR